MQSYPRPDNACEWMGEQEDNIIYKHAWLTSYGILIDGSLAHGDFDVHRSRGGGNVGITPRVFLTRLVETARCGVAGVIAIDRHTNTTAIDIVVRFNGVVVAVPSSVVGIGKISLAPRAIELTIFIPVAGLRERNLTIGGNTNDSLVAGFQIEEEPSVAARASHVSTGSLPVISDFVPQSNSDWTVGSEGDGVIMAIRIAIAQG